MRMALMVRDWVNHLGSRLPTRRARSKNREQEHTRRLSVEALENRQLLSAFAATIHHEGGRASLSRTVIKANSPPGFIGGAAGAKRLQQYAPTEVTSSVELNQPLGQAKANRIARDLGLQKRFCFTNQQYVTFITGNGKNGSGNPTDAKLVDESIAILTNSNANPMTRDINGVTTQIVLGSYGLTVNTDGMLESPANSDSPSREVNSVIAPGGYLSTWAAANGAQSSLKMLYKSAYTVQLPYGTAAQHEGTDAELALYRNGAHSAVTGLSMVSSIWEINFALIYVLNPKLAATMPAYWTGIPGRVVAALETSQCGEVPFSEYASYFNDSPDRST